MEKNFIKHFATIGTGTIINLLLGLLTTPIITRLVDPEQYGQYSIFGTYSNIALMVLCLGLDQALVRYYYEREELSYKRKLFYDCVKIPALVGIVLGIAVIFLSSTKIISFEFNTSVIVCLCINILIQLFYRFTQLMVRLSYKSKVFATLNVVHKISYVGIALLLIFVVKKEYLLLLAIATTLSGAICLIGCLYANKETWLCENQPFSAGSYAYSDLLKYGAPYIISMGITSIFQGMDKIALNTFSSYSEVGIYASTMSLVHVFAIVQSTFNTLWAPISVEHYSKNPDDKEFYQKGNRMITVIMFFMGISLILVKDVFAILLGEKYQAAAYIFPCLIFNPIMYTISETTVSGIVFLKKSGMQVVVGLGACVSHMIGLAILVPQYGAQGAAISTAISYVVFFTLRTLISNRYYYIDFGLKKFYFLTACVAVYALYNTFNSFNIISVVSYIGCCIVIFMLYKKDIIFMINYVMDYIGNLLSVRKK